MEHACADFLPLPIDSQSVLANLEGAYYQWLEVVRELASIPVSMFWQRQAKSEYLTIKQTSSSSGKTCGVRSGQTEARLIEFQIQKKHLRGRLATTNALLADRARQCRALRLPTLPGQHGEILRALDKAQLLGNDLLVVGSDAFAAYEVACGMRFPVGRDDTDVFEFAWCRDTQASLDRAARSQASVQRPSLFAVLKDLDSSFKMSKSKPYQAVNSQGYEVELLAAPSTHPLPSNEPFSPMQTLLEQEWLLQGLPISCVIPTRRNRACPLYVPDPRWMAVHKLWLSKKPGRNPQKKPKDERQGNVLLDATRHFLLDSHPLDLDFVLSLPQELRDLFSAWAESRGFNPVGGDSEPYGR